MSVTDKLIIPLLDETLTKEDISPEAGFLSIYSDDINRPYLDNHIFLLYDINIDTTISYDRNKKLSESKNLYKKYTVTIKGFPMTLYVFTITSKAIKNIQQNVFNMSDQERMRIFRFWNMTDSDINAFMLNQLYLLNVKFVRKAIPEEDYKEPYSVWQKSGALGISAPL